MPAKTVSGKFPPPPGGPRSGKITETHFLRNFRLREADAYVSHLCNLLKLKDPWMAAATIVGKELPMSFRIFLAYLSQALYLTGYIVCIWLGFRFIALLNAITRYLNLRAVKVDPTMRD